MQRPSRSLCCSLGLKVSDEFAVPLCRVHHRAVHRAIAEPSWWEAFGIDPVKIAHGLWKHTRVNAGPVANPNPIALSEADNESAAAQVAGNCVGILPALVIASAVAFQPSAQCKAPYVSIVVYEPAVLVMIDDLRKLPNVAARRVKEFDTGNGTLWARGCATSPPIEQRRRSVQATSPEQSMRRRFCLSASGHRRHARRRH
jgi:hypothetical protein